VFPTEDSTIFGPPPRPEFEDSDFGRFPGKQFLMARLSSVIYAVVEAISLFKASVMPRSPAEVLAYKERGAFLLSYVFCICVPVSAACVA